MNEIKRLQQLAGIIAEVKINNPNELYKFQEWVIPYHKKLSKGKIDYDDLRDEFGEDTADAIQMTKGLKNPFTKDDIKLWLDTEWEDSWEGNLDSFTEWLREYDIIK